MKIQCDVCDKDEATFFCVADEAALCTSCDHRVHHANKLAGKHHRFSLHHPSPQQGPPLCDICKERRAFFFCQQDRAILCTECDTCIHKANEHTLKHTRYLLTGVRISSISTLYSSSSAAAAESSTATLTNNNFSKAKPPLLVNKTPSTTSKNSATTVQSCGAPPPESCDKVIDNNDPPHQMIMSGTGNNFGEDLISTSSSSISEYLIEMLPGWHVEDFLDSSSISPYGFSKGGDDDLLSIWDADLECYVNAFPSEKTGIWVPQASPPPPAVPLHQTHNQSYLQSTDLAFGGIKEQSTEFSTKNSSRKRTDDSSFLVPQIGPPFNASKRSRTFW